LKDLVEHLTGTSDKRFPLDVFLGSRRFADDQQLRIRVPAADDDVRACLASGSFFMRFNALITSPRDSNLFAPWLNMSN
jgi:hypothetical protein